MSAVRRAAQRVEDPAARHELDAVRALMRAISAGTTGQRIEHATAVLRDPGRFRAAYEPTPRWLPSPHRSKPGTSTLRSETASDAIAIADARARWRPRDNAANLFGDALWPAGRLDEAESVASAGYARALEHADHRRGLWCRLLGSIALVRGDARRGGGVAQGRGVRAARAG